MKKAKKVQKITADGDVKINGKAEQKSDSEDSDDDEGRIFTRIPVV
jgi:hypothetical protein